MDKKSVEGEQPVYLCNYTDVYYRDRISPDIPFMNATATSNQIASFSIRCGDVLITKDSETADDIAVPAYVTEDMPRVLCGYHLALLRPGPQTDGRYLFWTLASRSPREQFAALATGVTRFGLRYEAFGDVTVPHPSLPIQRAIADYLEVETGRIDALIDKKRRMTQLLNEQRQSLITQAVTGQLGAIDSNTSVAALGFPRLKTVARVAYGLGQPPPLADQGVPIIRATNIDHGRITADSLIFSAMSDLPLERAPLLEAGEILVVRSGANTGDSALIGAEWAGSAPGYDLRVTPFDADSSFLAYVLLSDFAKGQIDIARNRAAQPHLNAEDLNDLRVWLPELQVQCRIAIHLDAATGQIDDTYYAVTKQIDLLGERRESLITAAVNGEVEIPGLST